MNVRLSRKQARKQKKTVPWWGFYSSSLGPTEYFVRSPFGLIIVLWDQHDSPSVYCQTAATNGERKNEVGRGEAISPVQVREPPRRHCSFPGAKGRWEIGARSFKTSQTHKPTQLHCCFHKCFISFIILWRRLSKCVSFEELFTGSKVMASTSVFPIT